MNFRVFDWSIWYDVSIVHDIEEISKCRHFSTLSRNKKLNMKDFFLLHDMNFGAAFFPICSRSCVNKFDRPFCYHVRTQLFSALRRSGKGHTLEIPL